MPPPKTSFRTTTNRTDLTVEFQQRQAYLRKRFAQQGEPDVPVEELLLRPDPDVIAEPDEEEEKHGSRRPPLLSHVHASPHGSGGEDGATTSQPPLPPVAPGDPSPDSKIDGARASNGRAPSTEIILDPLAAANARDAALKEFPDHRVVAHVGVGYVGRGGERLLGETVSDVALRFYDDRQGDRLTYEEWQAQRQEGQKQNQVEQWGKERKLEQ